MRSKIFIIILCVLYIVNYKIVLGFSSTRRTSHWYKNSQIGVWNLPNKTMNQKLVARALLPDIYHCADEVADKDSNECKGRGCYFCCYDRLCYIKQQHAYDCFDRESHCDALCDDEFTCRLYGCAYNDKQKTCRGKKGKGVVGLNYCGPKLLASNGVVYLNKTFQNINPSIIGCLPGAHSKSRCNVPMADDKLYRDEVFVYGRDGNLTLDLPIPEDAKYEVGLHICDPLGHARDMKFYINDLYIGWINVKTNETKVHVERKYFTTNYNVNDITVDGVIGNAAITNSKVVIKLQTFGYSNSPVLSAVYLKKLT